MDIDEKITAESNRSKVAMDAERRPLALDNTGSVVLSLCILVSVPPQSLDVRQAIQLLVRPLFFLWRAFNHVGAIGIP